MSKSTEEHATVDMGRFAKLDDRYGVGVCVSPDGSEMFWIVRLDRDDGTDGCNCSLCAPHDQATPFVIGVTTRRT